MAQNCLRVPAFQSSDAFNRAWLIEQHQLVAAYDKDLATGFTLRCREGDGQIGDLFGAHGVFHPFHTLRTGFVFYGDGGDHAGPCEGGYDVGANVSALAFHGNNARQACDPHFGGGIIGLANVPD